MSWETVTFGSICNLVNGKAFKPSDWSTSGVPIIRIQNLNEADKPFNFWAGSFENQVLVRTGDLLLAWSGTPGTSFGCHIWYGSDSVLNQHIFRCDLDRKSVTPEWVKFAVNVQLNQLIQLSHGGVGLKHVTRKVVEELRIPLPSLEEQKRIADILDRAEALQTKRLAALAQLDELIPSIFLDVFGDPVTNPKGWTVKKLDELISDGPQNGLYKPSSDYGSGTPILRIDAFYDGHVTKLSTLKRVRISDEELNLYRLSPGDVVINRVNSMEYLGKSAIIPDLDEPIVFESNMMRFSVDQSQIEPRYLVQFLQTSFIKGQLMNSAKHAVNQSSINQKDVKGFQVNVPPLPLQKEFIHRIQAIEKIKATHKASLTELDELFVSLQYRAFRGEL